jgi:hypothetical protein
MKLKNRQKTIDNLLSKCTFRSLSSLDYRRLNSTKVKSISFLWLDEILYDCESQFRQTIEPFQWQFFNNVSSCVSFIDTQLRERRYIILVASGTLGNELFHTAFCLTKQIFAAYIYCAQLRDNKSWSSDHPQIRGVYNDPTKLANQIKQDYNQLQITLGIEKTGWYTASDTTDENKVN